MNRFACLFWVSTLAASVFAAEGELLWEYATSGVVFGSPAVDSAGVSYVGSRSSNLFAIDSEGNLKWSFEAEDWVDSSPALSHDESVVYFGSWDNRLYAVDTQNGTMQWSYETQSLVVASPAVGHDGTIYVGSSDGIFYAVNPDGSLKWSYLIAEELDSSPAIAPDGSIYVGAFDGSLYSFSPDGNLRWSFETQVPVLDPDDHRLKSPPTVAFDGTVYFGAGNRRVYALDEDGNQLWNFAALEIVDTGVVIAPNGDLIFGSRDGNLYRIDASGDLVWKSFVGDIFYSTPAMDANGLIYVGSFLGDGVSALTALSSDGEIVWDYTVLDFVDSSPAITPDGRVLFGGYDGSLYAVEGGAGLVKSEWSRFGAGLAQRAQQGEVGVEDGFSLSFYRWAKELGLEESKASPSYVGGDGESSLLKFATGGEPDVFDGSSVELICDSDGKAFRFNARLEQKDVIFRLEISDDGELWESFEIEEEGLEWEVVDPDPFGDGLFRRYEVRSTESADFSLARLSAEVF